jgi:hypothetical protein
LKASLWTNFWSTMPQTQVGWLRRVDSLRWLFFRSTDSITPSSRRTQPILFHLSMWHTYSLSLAESGVLRDLYRTQSEWSFFKQLYLMFCGVSHFKNILMYLFFAELELATDGAYNITLMKLCQNGLWCISSCRDVQTGLPWCNQVFAGSAKWLWQKLIFLHFAYFKNICSEVRSYFRSLMEWNLSVPTNFRSGGRSCQYMPYHVSSSVVHPWWGLTYVGSIVQNSEIYHRGQVFCFYFFLR